MKDITLITTKSGKKFIARAFFPNGNVRVWGELVEYYGLETKHAETGCLLVKKDDILTADDVQKTPALVQELFQQYLDSVAALGKTVFWSRNGRKYSVA